MNATDLANAIVRQAGRFIGLREVRPNAEWENPKTPGRDLALAEELRTMDMLIMMQAREAAPPARPAAFA